MNHIVEINGIKMVDIWLSTGYWKVRRSKAEGHGFFRMLRYFQILKRNEND